MKALAITLSGLLTLNSAFAGTTGNYVPKSPTARCKDFLSDMSILFADPKIQDEALGWKRDIDTKISQEIKKQGHIIPVTATGGIVALEDLMLLLTQPNMTETIRRKVAPVQDEIFALIKKIWAGSKAMADMKRAGIGKYAVAKRHKFKQLEDQFIKDSMEFGAKYGYYVNVMRLLISVSKGQGAKDPFGAKLPFEEPTSLAKAGAKAALEEKKEKTKEAVENEEEVVPQPNLKVLLYDLNSPLAIQQATDALKYLDSQRELSWVQGQRRLADEAALNEVEFVFRNNIYALIGKLQRDLSIQKRQRGVISWVARTVAGFWMGMTSFGGLMPDKYRNILAGILIMFYDRIMVDKYLDRILTVVNATRSLDENGNVVVLNSEEKLEAQLKMLLTMIGDRKTYKDFLLTYARILYYTNTWSELMRVVKKKAEDTATYSQQYSNLYEWMKEAEELAKSPSIGPISILHEPSKSDYILMLTIQLGYLLALEEGAANMIFDSSLVTSLRSALESLIL